MRVQLRFIFLIAVFCTAFSVLAQNDTIQSNQAVPIPESVISLLFSYYEQDGNNSPVTGGIGTEELTDIGSKIIVTIPLDERKTLNFDVGFDYYTSASTDNIDSFVSSASSKDVRVHGNIGLTFGRPSGLTYGFTVGGSGEYDYGSLQFSGFVSKISKNGMTSYGLSGKAFLDRWEVIYPQELRGQEWVTTDQRRTYSLSGNLNQVINKRMQIGITADLVTQSGLLGTPFHRVYFSDQAEARVENLPFNRLKIPVGVRFNYYATDKILFRSHYRFYWDDWGIKGHTVSLEVPYKIHRFFSVYPFYRYHTQSASTFFKPYAEHTTDLTYYTSDYDLSGLDSHNFGLGIRYSPASGITDFKLSGKQNHSLKMKGINLRYGHFRRDPGLIANIMSLVIDFSF